MTLRNFVGDLLGIVIAVLLLSASAHAKSEKEPPSKCAPDAVPAGSICMDTWEASVWTIPVTAPSGKSNRNLIAKVRDGIAKLGDLTDGGATQLGTASDDYAPCTDDGQTCKDDIYALSLPGVTPSANITWFQANVACANVGKRLPSNAEWQMAVTGSPVPVLDGDNGTTDCNTESVNNEPVPTGSRSGCLSAFGAFDMVGNVSEWVADWVPRSGACGNWIGSDDTQCLAGVLTTGGPGALLRGGSWAESYEAGALYVDGTVEPTHAFKRWGFRCAL